MAFVVVVVVFHLLLLRPTASGSTVRTSLSNSNQSGTSSQSIGNRVPTTSTAPIPTGRLEGRFPSSNAPLPVLRRRERSCPERGAFVDPWKKRSIDDMNRRNPSGPHSSSTSVASSTGGRVGPSETLLFFLHSFYLSGRMSAAHICWIEGITPDPPG